MSNTDGAVAPPVTPPAAVTPPATVVPPVAETVTPPAGDPPKPSLAAEAPKPAAAKPDAAVAFAVDKIKFPEGFVKDDKALGDFGTIINDAALSPQDRGQKLIDLYANGLKQVGEANTKAWNDMNDKWVSEIKADPELGGDKLSATTTVVSKLIDSLGEKNAAEMRQALNVTGAGNNPAIVRAMKAFADKLIEGGHITGTPPSKPGSIADTFFPSMADLKKG